MTSSEFIKVRLGDIADIQTGPFGSQLHKRDYKEKGTPIITVEHLGQNRIIHKNLPFVSDEDKERLKKFIIKEGDIVFSRVGSVDRRAFVCKKEDGWLFSGRCLRVRVFDNNINPLYLSYYFGLENFKEYIRRIAVGATMPSLNTKIMSDIEVKFPAKDVQDYIAVILSSLDDKIEFNNRINQTLEEIAQAIFKHWFVDFEFPDENGQPYKSSGGEMDDSEFGPIPRGWSIINLEEICTINMGQSPPSSSYNETGYGLPFYQGVRNFGFRHPGVSVCCSEPKKVAEKNDVLLSVRAPVGEINLAVTKCCIGRGVAALCMKESGNNFLYYTLIDNKKRLLTMESGSVFTAINKSNISNFPIIYPGKKQVIVCLLIRMVGIKI
jgi:type I restriction enzyme S subunit